MTDEHASGATPESTAPLSSDPRLSRLQEQFGDKLRQIRATESELDFLVEAEILSQFVLALRGEVLAAQHSFCDACGIEREESLETVYRFSLLSAPVRITVRVQMPKSRPVVPSLSGLYKGALWPEREFAEMFGIQVEGHPDLRHLLLPENWQGFPLRKDYVYPLDHPWLAPDPLRDDPAAALCPADQLGEESGPEAE